MQKRERLGCFLSVGIIPCFLEIIGFQTEFRKRKGIDQFCFTFIGEIREDDIALIFECHDPSACIGFAGSKVDSLTEIFLYHFR